MYITSRLLDLKFTTNAKNNNISKGFDNMKRQIDKNQMAKGYEEMGAINLQISKDFFHLETEGEKYYEMDSEKAEGNSKE